ncbi:hypothetical protein TNCV_4332601 [Trichonephila clavipes]|nr:hypothetical protein TNCV_4332601 [Trichonephila clavipes]
MELNMYLALLSYGEKQGPAICPLISEKLITMAMESWLPGQALRRRHTHFPVFGRVTVTVVSIPKNQELTTSPVKMSHKFFNHSVYGQMSKKSSLRILNLTDVRTPQYNLKPLISRQVICKISRYFAR